MRKAGPFLMLILGMGLSPLPLLGQAAKDTAADKDKLVNGEINGKRLEQWLTEAADKDPALRQVAIRTLVQFGPQARKAIPVLLTALHDPDQAIRADALAGLGLVPLDKGALAKADIDSIKNLIEDPQRMVRIQAAITISRAGTEGKAAIPALAAGVIDFTSWELRKACCYALGQVSADRANGPDSRSVQALVRALGDPCAQVRFEAIKALGELGMPRPAELEMEKTALTARISTDRDKVVVIWARVLLIFLDKNVVAEKGLAAIAMGLDDADPRVRAQAAFAMGVLSRPSLSAEMRSRVKQKFPDLINALRDREPEVVVSVLQGLGMFGEDVNNAVVEAVADAAKDSDPRIRAAGVRALGAIRASGHINAIIEELKNKDPELVAAAIDGLYALGELAGPGLAGLEPVARGDNEVLKAAANAAIDHIKEAIRNKK